MLLTSTEEERPLNLRFAHYSLSAPVSSSAGYDLWLAEDLNSHRIRLLKLTETGRHGSRDTEILRYEYDLLQSFPENHPSRPLEFVADDKGVALAFERDTAVPLDQYLPEGTGMDLVRFFSLALGMVSVLRELHSLHIVHRDIKPSNIVINPETRELHLINFGSAVRLDVYNQEIQNPDDMIVGSLAYISPEQTGRMDCATDYRTDFYSLGVVLYQWMTGRLPFQSDDDLGMISCHLAKLPAAPSSVNPDIPPMVSNVILKLMEKEKGRRYQSCHGLLHDLEICLTAYRQFGVIPDFQLGTRDISNRFAVSDRFFGREDQLQALTAAFEKARDGQSVFVLVQGYSGVGKTALINRFRHSVTASEVFFIQGKFDYLQQEIAYSAISQAFQDLANQLLVTGDAEFNDWISRISKAVRGYGRLIVDMVPTMEAVIGEQPELEPVDPASAQTRVGIAFARFVQVFARPEHPLILFVDDLQWADGESLKLLEYLATVIDTGSLMIIGAYRDNQVDDAHPLTRMVRRVEKFFPVQRIQLLPLHGAAVAQIVADTLHVSVSDVDQVAGVIYRKTRGNPFFVGELLKMLFWDGSVYFSESRGDWEWDEESIQEKEISDNMVDFMLTRLRSLPAETQALLHIAACMGRSFDLDVLSLAADQDWCVCTRLLGPALEQGHLVLLTEACPVVLETGAGAMTDCTEVRYRFLHDRIQEAAYGLETDVQRQKNHLSIARLLHQRRRDGIEARPLDEITRHYTKSIALLNDDHERWTVARLYAEAAGQAMKANSFENAMAFSGTALSLFPDTVWEDHYAIAWETFYIASESSFLCLQTERAEASLRSLMGHSATSLERLRATLMAVRRYNTMTLFDKTLKVGIRGLKSSGVRYRRSPGIFSIAVLLVRYWVLLRLTDRKKQAIRTRIQREMDPWQEVVAQIFYELSFAAFSVRDFFFIPYSAARVALHLISCRRLTPELFSFACVWCSCGAQIFFKDYGAARRWTGFSTEVLGRELSDSDSPEDLFLFGFYILPFQGLWPRAHQTFRRAKEMMTGKGVSCSAMNAIATFFEGQMNFLNTSDMIPECESNLKLLEHFGNVDNLMVARSSLNFFRQLNEAYPLDDETAQLITDNIINHAVAHDSYAAGHAYLHNGILTFLRNDYRSARISFRSANKYLILFGSTFFELDLTLFSFLCASCLYPHAGIREKIRLRLIMAHAYRKMKQWSSHNPDNFLHQKRFMDALYLGMRKRFNDAVEVSRQAAQLSEDKGFTLHASLIHEQAALFCQEQGLWRDSRTHMQDAAAGFEQIGWNSKARRLQALCAGISTREFHPQGSNPS